jgi:hypothetical protein
MIDIDKFTYYQHGDGSWTLTGKAAVRRDELDRLSDEVIVKGRTRTCVFQKAPGGLKSDSAVAYWDKKSGNVVEFLIID